MCNVEAVRLRDLRVKADKLGGFDSLNPTKQENKMEAEELRELLRQVWRREVSADEAWEEIDGERKMPDGEGSYWLPIYGD